MDYQQWMPEREFLRSVINYKNPDLAGRLFDKDMRRAWVEIAKALQERHGEQTKQRMRRAYWHQIMAAILNAYNRSTSKQDMARGELGERYKAIAAKARELSRMLRGTEELNHRLYYWGVMLPPGFDDDGAVHDAEPLYRYWAAHPTLSEILQHVSSEAKELANNPDAPARRDERYKEIIFIRALTDDFKRYLGKELQGSVAAITSAAFVVQIDRQFVKYNLKNTV